MLSRNEDILYSIINGEVYEKVPQSRMEALLLELKDVIEAGGGGGDFDPDSYYTKPQTDARITEKVAEIVSDAPEDFDTLKEMSDWIDSHEDSAAAMNTAIQANTTAIAGKVDKVSGKGLSTNDFTTAEKTKLAALENYDDSQIVADISALQTSISGKASLSTFVGITQAEYDALETKTEPLYFIFEDEEESTVSNSAGTNSLNTLEISGISSNLDISESETEISIDKINSVSEGR